MLQRRQFFGSIAAASAVVTIPSVLMASPQNNGLDWQCRVIETLPHNRAGRHPVVTGVDIQKGSQSLAIVGDDHKVCIYDLVTNKYTKQLAHHRDWVRAAKFSPTGDFLATCGNDRQFFIWKTNDWMAPTVVKHHPEAIIDLAFSPDSQSIATVGFANALRIYDVKSGSLKQNLKCDCADNHAVAFSKDSKWIAAGGRSGHIRVWNVLDGEKVAEFDAHQRRIRSLEFVDNQTLLSCSDDQTTRLTDLNNVANVKVLPRLGSKLYAVRMLDGGLVATGGSDNQIHIWQISDQSLVGSLKGHTGTVTSLDVDGTTLVSGSYDTHVRLWTMKTDTMAFKAPQGNRRAGRLPDGWSRKLK